MDHSETFLFSELFCGTPPSCLKVMGWVVGGGGGLQDFIVSPSPLLGLFGFIWVGLGGIRSGGIRDSGVGD